jgi:hypothetical protein
MKISAWCDWNREWIVILPALIAAMPVGATTAIFFFDVSLMYLRKVVFPVLLFP